MNKEKLAHFISFIFGPIFLWPLILFLIVFNSGLPILQQQKILQIVFILQIFMPLVLFIIALLMRIISDFDISQKEERYLPMVVFSELSVINLMLVRLYGNDLLFNFFLLLFLIIIINVLITIFWKISSHATINIVAIVLINYFFHWQYPYLFLSLPVIFWARLYLKRHTIAQLIGGFIINGGLLIYFLYFQNYLKL